MSLPRPYPPDTYHGADGEVSAWIRRDDEPPEITYRTGGTCEYLATGDRTEGRFGLYRWTFGEVETGPDAHFHRSISEQFYGDCRNFGVSGPTRRPDWLAGKASDDREHAGHVCIGEGGRGAAEGERHQARRGAVTGGIHPAVG